MRQNKKLSAVVFCLFISTAMFISQTADAQEAEGGYPRIFPSDKNYQVSQRVQQPNDLPTVERAREAENTTSERSNLPAVENKKQPEKRNVPEKKETTKAKPTNNQQESNTSNESESVLSFNILYYVIQKFKFTEVTDQ